MNEIAVAVMWIALWVFAAVARKVWDQLPPLPEDCAEHDRRFDFLVTAYPFWLGIGIVGIGATLLIALS
jgi:hypothetical protein